MLLGSSLRQCWLLDRLYTRHVTSKWFPFFETLALRTEQEIFFFFFGGTHPRNQPNKKFKSQRTCKKYPEKTINSLRVLKYLELTGFFVSKFFLNPWNRLVLWF
jgi:hypothetical protein